MTIFFQAHKCVHSLKRDKNTFLLIRLDFSGIQKKCKQNAEKIHQN